MKSRNHFNLWLVAVHSSENRKFKWRRLKPLLTSFYGWLTVLHKTSFKTFNCYRTKEFKGEAKRLRVLNDLSINNLRMERHYHKGQELSPFTCVHFITLSIAKSIWWIFVSSQKVCSNLGAPVTINIGTCVEAVKVMEICPFAFQYFFVTSC